MQTGFELLTSAEMGAVDNRAVELGVPSLMLMENAGRAVAEIAARMVPAGSAVLVLCGPGNNGGDGFVAARLLEQAGFPVSLALVQTALANGTPRLNGDAAQMASQWMGSIEPLTPELVSTLAPEAATTATSSATSKPTILIIDALFGAGLSRPLEGELAAIVRAVNMLVASNSTKLLDIKVLAVDVPSGLDGTTGQVLAPSQVPAPPRATTSTGIQSSSTPEPRMSAVIQAHETITFFRKKPGHLLLPGRDLCGLMHLADIGIPEAALDVARAQTRTQTVINAPGLWCDSWPKLSRAGHKYSRGHSLVVSGPSHQTGAARLGARAALRVGSGLVTIASPPEALHVNAAHLTSIMLTPCAAPEDLAQILNDKRKNAVLIGPGVGVGAETRQLVQCVLAKCQQLVKSSGLTSLLPDSLHVVLDADALTSFEDCPDDLFSAIKPNAGPARSESDALPPLSIPPPAYTSQVVLTPHDGEFARLFGAECAGKPKLTRAREAAARSGGVIVLKGADTVIAAPDGRAAINENAPPWLATAGSGDVLAGLIAGLLSQKLPTWEAACAAVWLHGECGTRLGRGLIAEDLPEILPGVLQSLFQT